jgi:hypothetical protein
MLTENLSLPADSKEVQKEFHLRKINSLKEELSMLTIQEHPRQIQSICRKIILIKNMINELERKNK